MKNKPWLDHYDQGIPATIDIPALSLVDLFKVAAEHYQDSIAIIHEDTLITYRQLDRLSDQVAGYLIAKGINKGDRVGILLGNTPEFVISYYGILKAGAVVMALNPAYRPVEVKSLASESGIRILILPDTAYETIKPIQNETGIESFVVVGENSSGVSEGDLTWDDLLAPGDGGDPVDVDVNPEDAAIFQYSGGTTGTPKCAVGLHRNLVANVFQFSHWLVNTAAGKETILVAIPMYHVYGMVLGMNLAVKLGARMVLVSNPKNLDRLLQAAEKHRATVFPGVPNLYAAINQYPPVVAGEYDLSSIKACISGSTTLPLAVKQVFEGLTHSHLVEGYGLSEAPTATHCNPILGENREGSIGLPLPNVDCKIVDLETGTKTCGVGEAGELIIRGPQVMAGYHQRPAETELAIRDGWLFTGDVVRMDADGYFYLIDRKKDVIKVGGFQVWPNEIEAVLHHHPKVREAAVAKVLDADGTEVAKAWVVLREGETSTPEEIRQFCDQFLTGYKIPKYISFIDSLPRTIIGKVLRRVLSQSD